MHELKTGFGLVTREGAVGSSCAITRLDHITKQHASQVSHTLFNVSCTDLCFLLKNITWVGFVYTGWK